MALELLFEGFDAAIVPCSFLLLVPGLACLLTARQESTAAGIGFGAAAVVAGWLFHSGRIGRPPDGLLALATGACLVALAIPLLRRLDLVALAGGGLGGAVSAVIWKPCGGEALGRLLTELPGRGLSGTLLFAAYLLGVLAPFVVLTVALHLLPGPALIPVRPAMVVVGGLVLGALAVTIAVGLDDNLYRWLVERSLS